MKGSFLKELAARWKLLLGAGVLAFGAMQLVQPTIEARPARDPMQMPSDVEAVLRTSCFDCHSNETKLLWFDRIAPGSWLVARDVRRARAVLNFSELGTRPAPEQRARLFEAIEMASSGVMPPAPYRALHRGAAVSSAGLETLRAFAASLAPPPSEGKVIDASLDHLAGGAKPEWNGLELPRDLASWVPVQMSERWDNGTVRIVAANPVAREAVAKGSLSPWPEGASLAKIAWKPGEGAAPSTFVQVELMEKRGAAWRFGRWVGRGLEPYGHDATFVEECQRCHEPMRDRDYVYSLPEASFEASWGTVASFRVEDKRFHLLARASDGTIRKLAWAQQDDPHWFGARISKGAPVAE